MNETFILALAWAAGFVLGAIFFGGLWWTARKGIVSRQPAIWFFGSLCLRMSIAVAGFYFVGHEHWERFLLCLLGFVAARLVVMRVTRPSGETKTNSAQEVGHAP